VGRKIAVLGGFVAAAGALLSCAAFLGWEPAPTEGELPDVAAAIPAEPDATPPPPEREPLPPFEDPLEIIGPSDTRVYYQFLDETGAVRFAASLEGVPEAWRDRAGRVELDVPPPHDPPEARVFRKLRNRREAAQDAP